MSASIRESLSGVIDGGGGAFAIVRAKLVVLVQGGRSWACAMARMSMSRSPVWAARTVASWVAATSRRGVTRSIGWRCSRASREPDAGCAWASVMLLVEAGALPGSLLCSRVSRCRCACVVV